MASLRSVVPVRAGLVFFLKLPTISARRQISLSVAALLFSVTITPAVSAATPPPLWECKAGYGLTVTVAAGLQSPNECVEPLKAYLKDNFVPFFCAFPGMTGYQVINIWLDEIQPVGTKVVWYEFGVGMLLSHPGSDRPFGCSETGAGGRAQVQECSVAPLPPYSPDPYPLDTGNLTDRMKTALQCMRDGDATTTPTSAYRPPAYNQHLIDVWGKWVNELKKNTTPACRALRAEVQAHFNRHELLESQEPALNSDHTRGEAIDMTSSLSSSNLDGLAKRCELYRPIPVKDPVHFIHR